MMFRRLRNRFLLLNLGLFSILMLAAFGAIYGITVQNINQDIRLELLRVADYYRNDLGGPGAGPHQDGGKGGGFRPFQPGGRMEPPPERSVSFALQTDSEWNLLSKSTRFDMEDDFYEQAKDEAVANPVENGRFTLDGTRWAYSVQQRPDGTGYSIVYLDVSAQQTILTNLIYTFTAVALVMFAAIFLASRYFAGRSIEPVREAFEKQRRFIADASHELKTPLAVINTNADVLLASGSETIDSQAKWLQRIKSETERMKTLTNDLLYLTEMEDAREQPLQVPFDLSDTVESVILTMEAVVYERRLELDYDIEPGLTAVGSAEQIRQVVLILLDNAIKYAGPQGRIAISLKKQHHHCLVQVTNTGEGIPEEHLERIFDRFYRVDASRSRKQGGYGLGLAIARSIVEQHKGRLYAKSVPGAETSFYMQLGG
ncbi:sensor histidine kinase [Paenibacillus pasadenensis]|uniref:sensor histidine kinase n=1 Tax=Paenibacillus pasadenensis TaxID=217090 RepID=UPI0003F60920|nr:HAMP domain-containing sensor histidine kinase [Paenibacillus pasadenensis]